MSTTLKTHLLASGACAIALAMATTAVAQTAPAPESALAGYGR